MNFVNGHGPSTAKLAICGEARLTIHHLMLAKSELAEARKELTDCAKMLRRGQKACERQGWEKGESTEAWYHAAGQTAAVIEIHDATRAAIPENGA